MSISVGHREELTPERPPNSKGNRVQNAPRLISATGNKWTGLFWGGAAWGLQFPGDDQRFDKKDNLIEQSPKISFRGGRVLTSLTIGKSHQALVRMVCKAHFPWGG